MRQLIFDPVAWEHYLEWQRVDKKMTNQINMLILECMRSPFVGRGQPEQLRHELSGLWSRRINIEHRLVYRVTENAIEIASCRYHY
ncbi:MAG: Txe/YoeB family addiction module toxin [Armatimonadota bacterium]